MRHRQSSIVATLAVVLGLSGVVTAAPAIAADEPIYYLPAPAETALIVSRGNGDTDGRSARQDYAFDFVAADDPERFGVVAARGGTVIGTRVGLRGGRCTEPLDGRRPACWRDVNYVLIDHGDGTSALYMHLKRREPFVRRGDVVSVGQPIGVAGSSGWTDEVGLGFQLQVTPTWNDVGRGGWFLTESIPVAFADPDVTTQRIDGVPLADDIIISGNPGAGFEPFRFHRRPAGLPASVPFEVGVERDITAAYQADSPDGYGLHFAAPIEAITDTLDPGFIPGTAVRPLFGGNLEFAGCASGESASLGRTVVTSFEVDGTPYLAVHG
ncbi:MAG: M23 family metallopeptidase, partial [Chloroflexota bacterium]|nr:M23 family metallopeptidase [Chloroflexota bacterium]